MKQLAWIEFLETNAYVSNELPSAPVYPSHGLPSHGNDGAITLPVFPFDPTTLPDNSLPTPPVTVWPPRPGMKFMVKYLACRGLILVPSNELPETAEPK
jgi:hypothetical protein